MKKSQINAILVNQTKRRNTVLALVCLILIFVVLSSSSLLIYTNRNKDYYVSYDETSNIDYKVFLKDNDFFNNNYLEANKQYIASLIDYINAKFSYNLLLEEKDVTYKYTYKIDALVEVKEKGSNYSIYNNTISLLKQKEETTSQKEVTISEDIEIDYNYYNNLIKKFVNVYELENVESTLTINMYVRVIGSCEEFINNDTKESIMSLTIPLTTKTVGIDLSDNLIDSKNNVLECKTTYSNNFIFIILGSIFSFITLCLTILTFKYIIKTRTAENIYERELKKILNNYGSYIQTIGSDFDFKEYQLLKLDNFTDMLEVRDTISQPILMRENKDKTGAYFIIPSSTKILYVYRLKVSDIEREMKKNSK